MPFKLAVDDLVGVNVKGKMWAKDGREKEVKFVLVCDRLDQAAMQAALNDGETTVSFFEKHAKDWQGQQLVLDDEGKPAPFSFEALQLLLSMAGMANLCWHSYVQQVQAIAKN